jgi:hypothetical protein
MTEKNVVLNRAVFAQRSFDSGALTVLTTLFHHFPEAGDYDLFVQRGEQVVQRAHVHVVAENAPHQLNVDLARLGESEKGCGCDAQAGYTVVAGGVIGFYVSQGVGQYNVTITQSAGGEKRALLNSSEATPEGDLFAVTLVQPGAYRATVAEGQGACEILVDLPPGQKYRVDQVTLVEVGKDGVFNPATVKLRAGQTVVFQCSAQVRIRVELQTAEATTAIARQRQRYTLRKPSTRTPKR